MAGTRRESDVAGCRRHGGEEDHRDSWEGYGEGGEFDSSWVHRRSEKDDGRGWSPLGRRRRRCRHSGLLCTYPALRSLNTLTLTLEARLGLEFWSWRLKTSEVFVVSCEHE